MQPNCCHHSVALRVNDAQVIRICVYHINFVLLGISGNAGGALSYTNVLHILEGECVNHADFVALAIGNVGVFAVGGRIVGELFGAS